MRACVTGGAGFIGSHVVDALLEVGWNVRVVDNARTGRWGFVDVENFKLDVTTDDLHPAFDGCDWVVHLAANADVRHGPEHPFYDLEQNTMGTARVLDAMRIAGVPNIFFASSASVYGTLTGTLTEYGQMPVQNSLYGASKLAGEALCEAYSASFGINATIGRWVQILGERYLHGHVIDIIRKIQRDPDVVTVLGDGTQRKNGLYVKDLARGIVEAMARRQFGRFNFATEPTFFAINDSIDIIAKEMGHNPVLRYTNERWIGDAPVVELSTTRARDLLDWEPTLSVPDAVLRTVRWLLSDDCDYL